MNLKALIALAGIAGLAVAASAQETVPPELAYPGNVALSRNSNGEWEYRKFPSLMPLYTYDLDKVGSGQSACGDTCTGARPPLTVDEGAKPIGRWTIIQREDGRKQWVYKGHPIYLRFHDVVGAPIGDNEENGTWHLMKP